MGLQLVQKNKVEEMYFSRPKIAHMYLQIPLQKWGANNVYLLVLSSWKVNILPKSPLP